MIGSRFTPERLMAVVCVFLISTLTLMLELVQTRIFSVLYWNHLVYFIVTMGLMGIAISGTVLSVSSKLRSLPRDTFYFFCLTGFSISSIIGLYIITSSPIDSFYFWDNPLKNVLGLLLSYSTAAVPYIFFGLLMSGTFLHYPEQSGTTYFFNLAGSAAGCIAYIVLIGPLGATALVMLIFVVSAVPAFFYLRSRGILIMFLMAVGMAVIVGWGWRAIEVLPDRNKQYWTSFKNLQVEFSQWNAISRIDVISGRGIEGVKRILIDGDAQAPLIRAGLVSIDAFLSEADTYLREAVYRLRGSIGGRGGRGSRVLVIGAGGGADVLVALKNNAQSVDAVEINPTTAQVVLDTFSEFSGNIYGPENVRLHIEDGRSFVRRSDQLYDVIMIHAVDTLGALSTGAYVLSENYLYTLEAFTDYWRHLEDDGMIQVSRWYFPGFPREEFRIFTTAYEALALDGVAEPSRHLLAIADGSATLAGIIISKRPFTREQISSVRSWLEQNNLHPIFDPTDENPGPVGNNAFNQFVFDAEKAEREEFYRNYTFNVKPVSDDKPFFFQYGRWSHVFKPYPAVHEYFDSIIGKWPFLTLLALIVQTFVLVVLIVWLPLLKLRKTRKSGTNSIPVVIYFALLGMAFMFVEMSMIQKLVLLLGHPIYSMSVTIPTILIAAGLGSLFTDFTAIKRDTLIVIVILALCALIGGWVLSATMISESVLSYSITVRIAASIMMLFPMGFLMGVPFPLGIRSLSDRQDLIPIAWATNGGMSVLGSIIAIVLAMQIGFSYVAVIAAVLYFAAMLCFFPLLNAVRK